MFKYIIGPLIAAFLAGWGQWYITQDSFDVRYTLSEKIPIAFGGDSAEAVQQIEVQNFGDKEVEKIFIMLPENISQHEIKLFSQRDKPEVSKTKTAFEVLYPSLPPKGVFKVIIKSPAFGVGQEDIKIRHSKGNAENALRKTSSTEKIQIFILVLYIILTVFYGLISYGAYKESHFLREVTWNPENILKTRKPFYMSSNTWEKLKLDAIKNWGDSGYINDLMQSTIEAIPIYKILNGEKPLLVSDEEWNNIKLEKSKKLILKINEQLMSMYFPFFKIDDVLGVINVPRPKNFPQDKWDSWKDDIQKKFFEIIKCQRFEAFDYVKNIGAQIPIGVNQKMWDNYKEDQSKKFFYYLNARILDPHYGENLFDVLDNERVDVLAQNEQKKLRSLAYKKMSLGLPEFLSEYSAENFLAKEKPSWMNEADYEKYRGAALKIVEIFQKNRKNDTILHVLNSISKGFFVDDDYLKNIDSDLRDELKKLDQKIRLAKQENIADREKIGLDCLQLEIDKKKITSQLQIIYELFNDPETIERVESYNNPFSEGNFKLLKKLSVEFRNLN